MNKLRIFILLCVFMSLTTVIAQSSKDSIVVRGAVKDAFTYELLDHVNVEFLRTDSTSVFNLTTRGLWKSYGFVHNIDAVEGIKLRKGQSYIIRLKKEGYETVALSYKAKAGHREDWMQLPAMFMRKIKKSALAEKTLGEAVVRASKVRMVVKGDTLEWNADAFQLQNGSMLDGLLKMLPGFSINGGQITVNGEQVSSLLVNGEDFFRGDPRVALENLPAFMVDKVKSYHQSHAYSYITQERNIKELPLVVDVRLKKQYSIGWTANAEAGYGLHNRYMGQLFGLRFTTNSRVAAYGNANNTNDTREPGTSGEWNPQGSVGGQTDRVKGGVEALIKDKKNRWKYMGNVKVLFQKSFSESATSGETFMPQNGSVFTRSTNKSHIKNYSVESVHNLELRNQANFISMNLSGFYEHSKNQIEGRNAEFNGNPFESYRSASLDSLFAGFVGTGNNAFFMPSSSAYLDALLMNKSRNDMFSKKNTWQTAFSMESFYKVPHTPDYMHLSGDVRVKRENQDAFSDYVYYVPNSEQSSERRNWFLPNQNFTINGQWNAQYRARLDPISIETSYTFTDDYADSNSPRYRLDALGTDMPAFALLPSTIEALHQTMDKGNSLWTCRNTMRHNVDAEFIFYWSDFAKHIHIKPVVIWQHDRLSYHRNTLNLFPRRSKWLFEPEVSYRMDDFYVEYKLSHALPNVISMQPYMDDSDPLNIVYGNTDLKIATNHRVDIVRSFRKEENAMTMDIAAYWNMTKHALAYGQTLNETTGVRSYKPCNVNGNWQMGVSLNYGRRLDKHQRFIFHNAFKADYMNSVDYVSARSSVRNLGVNERFKLDMRMGKVLLNATINGRYLHATSQRSSFADINSFDITYSLGSSVQLPLDFNLMFDLNLLEREGYSDHTMNDLRFVANAQLHKMFMQGKLRVTLQGFDIFQGLSNVTKVINAQGITETWHNALPSYVMLRFAYRFDMKKK